MTGIKAKYENEQYMLQYQEQTIIVPASLMNRFVLAVEGVYYSTLKRAKIQMMKREAEAEKLVKEADHPDVLPFTDKTQERPPYSKNVLPSPEEPPPMPKEVLRIPKGKRKGLPDDIPRNEKFR